MDLVDRLTSTQEALGLKGYQMAGELSITPEWYSKITRRRETASGDLALRLDEMLRRRRIDPASFFEGDSTLMVNESPLEIGERTQVEAPLQRKNVSDSIPGRVIAPSDYFSPPSHPPDAEDIHAYVAKLVAATGGDPKRLGWLMDELHTRCEERRLHWLKNPPQT
ncbi:hypothetical protein [Actomonas aquatica]|uniref:HTH cro/C1-type domain-containing protein n=1 Tax=Actomonas aquatica TaxID=2866162 RepID=A0ABZ1CD97_9BACT|nr:hypothetical protein [Opitutus sp. WL0086]WRQ89387.1 hypothetical protein K1X11_008195 [Opitutus sp. WL0086]